MRLFFPRSYKEDCGVSRRSPPTRSSRRSSPARSSGFSLSKFSCADFALRRNPNHEYETDPPSSHYDRDDGEDESWDRKDRRLFTEEDRSSSDDDNDELLSAKMDKNMSLQSRRKKKK